MISLQQGTPLEQRVKDLEQTDRLMAMNCPLYPGKEGDGNNTLKQLDERIDAVERTILEGKWLLRCIAVAGLVTWGKDWWPIISRALLGGP